MRTIGVLVNGDADSAAGARARGLFDSLADRYGVRVAYRERGKGRSLVDFTRNLVRWRPDVCYVVNPSVSGAWAGIGARLARICPFIVDTGDVAYSLARLVGNTNWFTCQAIRVTEGAATRFATSVVVRGTYHKEMLERSGRHSVYVVRDGVHASAYDR